jgi:hypothetical protein
MNRVLFAFPFLLTAGLAAAQSAPQRLVADSVYEANGSGPDWRLAIGDRIALRLAPDADGFVVMQYFPRARARNVGEVRRWESRTPGGTTIVIEARRAPCTLGDQAFRDSVTIVTGDRRLSGCGGPRLRNPAPQP